MWSSLTSIVKVLGICMTCLGIPVVCECKKPKGILDVST